MKTKFTYFLLAGVVILLVGLLNSASGQQNNMLDSLTVALNRSTNNRSKIKILLRLSELLNCDRSAEKVQYILRAEKIAEEFDYPSDKLRTLTFLGNYYFICQKNHSESIHYYGLASNLAENEHNDSVLALSQMYIAKNYEAMSLHHEALSYLNKAFSRNANRATNMSALGDMGRIYCNIGDYRQALICYNKSLEILDKYLQTGKDATRIDTITKVGLLLNIGDIYLTMSQSEKALEHYKTGYTLGAQVHYPILQFYSVLGMGKAYFARKDYVLASEKLESALNDSRTLKQPMYEAAILCQLADLHLATNEVDIAQRYAAASLKMAADNGFSEQLPKTYTTLGKLATMRHRNDTAIAYLQKAIGYCQKTKALDDEKNAWEALSDAYSGLSLTAKAFDAYKKFISLRDSMYSIDKANELVRIDLQAGFSRKQIADSLRQQGIYELKMQKQQTITYASYLGLAFVLVLSFFVYRNYQVQKKYNALLSKEKERHLAHIEEQSNVLTDIAFTQSHELRGPVATLLGLTEIFNHDDPADPNNMEVLEGITLVTKRLDKVITEIVQKENKVHQQGNF